MKVLVTGGAGFIASHIVDAYIQAGHQVAVVDDLSSGVRNYVHNNAHFYHFDICQKGLEDIFASFQPDVVSHHAAQISVSRSIADPQHDAHINVIGMINVLECAAQYHTKKIVFASSGGAIYGNTSEPATEDTVPQMNSPYGVTKFAGESYCKYYATQHRINYTILRYSNVYGPRQTTQGEAGAVALFCKQILKGEKTMIYGARAPKDGGGIRDYVFVGDVVRANILALTGANNEILNISTGIGTKTEKLYDLILEYMRSDIEPIYGPPRLGDIECSIISSHRATDRLGWCSEVSLSEGIKQTVAFYRADKD